LIRWPITTYLQSLPGDLGHLVAVESVGMGIASWALHRPMRLHEISLPGARGSAKELAQTLLSDDPLRATIGLACMNSLLPLPPQGEVQHAKAQDLILAYGTGKKVAIIGHFPFVDKIRPEFSSFWVLEKSPRRGDLPAEEAERILPNAEVIAISATTLANGTLADILSLCSPSAKKIMLGPSTPLSPVLFACGIDIIAGGVVEDRNLVKQGILAGLPFKQLKGYRYVVWGI
jgi:uncharacterized protein